MHALRTFCLVVTLALAQVVLARAEGPGVTTFITLYCPMPVVECTQAAQAPRALPSGVLPPSGVQPSGGIAIRRRVEGADIRRRGVTPFVTLQMNLCNSGIAGCFTGRVGDRATRMVLERVPAVVTVNEACESDVTEQLLPAMLALHPNEWLFWTFAPAAHRGSHRPVECTPEGSGRERGRFGNGMVGRLFSTTRPAFSFEGGLFPDDRLAPGELQDRAHAEMRSWVCADANGFYRACTTHLDDPSATGAGTPEHARVASNQCRFLSLSTPAGGPTVILGDLNLGTDPGARYNVQGCIPEGWSQRGDGAVQHALASNGFAAAGVEVLSMAGTTDHPALVVVLRAQDGARLTSHIR